MSESNARDVIDRDYLTALTLTAPIHERLEAVVEQLIELSPEPLEELFITDQATQDGGRLLQSVWAFSPNFALEAKNFLHADVIDVVPLSRNIVYMQITSEAGGWLGEVTPQSRLLVQMNIGTSTGLFTASGGNCERLRQVIRDRFKPNVAASSRQ